MKKQMKQLCGIGLIACIALSGTACASSQTTAAESERAESTVESAEESAEEASGQETLEETKEEPGQETPEESGDGENRENGGPGGRRGGEKRENEPELQAVLDANADRFEQLTYEDAETGITLEYSLYIPEGYDESGEYPLLMYIPDSSGSGKSAKELVEQYYGATIWVTDEEQQKHPSFVVVPAFSETVVDDDWNVSEQVDAAVHLLEQLQSDYSIDSDRIYTTGQSMGCMTSLYLNSIYPDLFAASMYVSGQWDISVLKCLEN